MPMQDYKSRHVAVITHTHARTGSFWPVVLLPQPADLKSGEQKNS